MYRSKSQSIPALAAHTIVDDLQKYFVYQLDRVTGSSRQEPSFGAVEWYRDEGRHGGGIRYGANNQRIFNRASINVSQIQYDDDPSKRLSSATALSTIIHPDNPYAPSLHLHISWTENKGSQGYWRLMADLNPSIVNDKHSIMFVEKIKQTLPDELFELASKQGDQYFFIPVLDRHRGVAHYYLEEYRSGQNDADFRLAHDFGKAVIDIYLDIFIHAIRSNSIPMPGQYLQQLEYHSLYFLQVLTLDRGTTSGLLIHNDNDLGIMGSLPAHVDKQLLIKWLESMPVPQDELLQGLIDVISGETKSHIDDKTKLKLAEIVRQHYQKHPKALTMQAQGFTVPTTVDNHESSPA